MPDRVARGRSRWLQLPALDLLIQVPPRRLAWFVLVVVVSGYGSLSLVGVVFQSSDAVQGVVSGAVIVAALAIQLGYVSRPDVRHRPRGIMLALTVLAILVFLPLLAYGSLWHGLPGLLAGSALLLLPRPAGSLVFTLVVLLIGVETYVSAVIGEAIGVLYSGAYAAMSTAASGLVVYGMSTLVRLVHQAHEAREEFRRAAVAAERVRLGRDVHDLLGQSLSGIALRGELIARLIGRDDAQARRELAEVLVAARAALADVRRVVGIRRELDEDQPHPATAQLPQLAPRLSRVMLVGVLAAQSVAPIVAAGLEESAAHAISLAVVRVLLIGGVLLAVRLDRSSPLPTRLAVLLLLAVVAYVPQLLLGPYTHSYEALAVAAGLLLLRPAVAVPLGLAATGGAVLIEYLDPAPTTWIVYSMVYIAVSMVQTTALVFGLGLLARLVLQVHAARTEVGRVAVAGERLRVARDVHDLLGLGLSAVTLRCELADRLLEHDPQRARTEIAGVLDTVQDALSDIRSVVGGDRELSLEAEWRSVVATLQAAAVEVRADREEVSPSGPAGTVLATVLREGITNVLRHSTANWCEISLRGAAGAATLTIANDGVHRDRERDDGACPDRREGGNGLRNMSERVEALGGQLQAGREDAVYRLWASVPTDRRRTLPAAHDPA